MIVDETHYCEVHPDRETELRCNKCERYMCAHCAVQTPVGYRCRECVRQVEDRFFNAQANDPAVLAGVCAILSAIAGAIISLLGLFLIILLSFPVAGVISEVALRAVNKRRGRNSAIYATIGVVVGGMIGSVVRAILVYPPAPYDQIVQLADSMGMPLPPGVPTLTDYIIDSTLSLGVILFIAITAYAVYIRVKT